MKPSNYMANPPTPQSSRRGWPQSRKASMVRMPLRSSRCALPNRRRRVSNHTRFEPRCPGAWPFGTPANLNKQKTFSELPLDIALDDKHVSDVDVVRLAEGLASVLLELDQPVAAYNALKTVDFRLRDARMATSKSPTCGRSNSFR